MGRLTVLSVKSAKPGRHADGLGLYLLVKPSGARSWLLRVQVDGRRRDIGLGSIADLTLAEARDKAAELRKVARAGLDPVTERDKDRRPVPTFKEAAIACHNDLQGGWAPKNAAAFLASLKEHVFPAIGHLRVDHVEAPQLRDMLAPIWTTIPVMAQKVRQRATIVLHFAKAKGWRSTEVPGRSITVGLARHGRGGNFAAMPYGDVPSFVAQLEAKPETVGRLALLFTIYTAARSGEVRSARWSHLDFEQKLWNRPADLMKAKTSHNITLSDDAIAILRRSERLRTEAGDGLVFPGTKGCPLSDMTLSKILRDAKVPFTVHGFRSSFRDFAAEQVPTIPDSVAESALAHAVSDKVVAAYKRTQFLTMRRQLLNGWADFISGRSNVLKFAANG